MYFGSVGMFDITFTGNKWYVQIYGADDVIICIRINYAYTMKLDVMCCREHIEEYWEYV